MSPLQRTVLITGCSDNGLGAYLCLAFQASGWRVFATGRDLTKLTTVKAAGIETIDLDITSEPSIKAAASTVSSLTDGSLDMLINNAGVAGSYMPLLDLDLDKMRATFETNCFSLITVSRAFLPLLMKSTSMQRGARGGTIVNQTSLSSLVASGLPFQGAYNASKAAATSMTEVLRLELAPFGVKVINLMTGMVAGTTILANSTRDSLPPASIFAIARTTLEGMDPSAGGAMNPEQWATKVVKQLVSANPSHWIWEGKWCTVSRILGFLPVGAGDSITKGMVGLDVVEKKVQEAEKEKMKKQD